MPYVDKIARNINTIDYPNVEIIISDRHCHDGAAKYLEDLFAGDPRVRVVANEDQAGYARHINWLIRNCTGKYFRFIPHDDTIPKCQLKDLVEIMESNSECVLVYGPIRRIYTDHRPGDVKLPKTGYKGRWTYETSAFMMYHGYHGASFKGLIRTSAVRDSSIYLPETDRLVIADRCWIFALSLVGRFCIYHEFSYEKLIYPTSTYAGWLSQQRPVDLMSQFLFMWREHKRLDNRIPRLILLLIVGGTGTLRKILTLPGMPPVIRKVTNGIKMLMPTVLFKAIASRL